MSPALHSRRREYPPHCCWLRIVSDCRCCCGFGHIPQESLQICCGLRGCSCVVERPAQPLRGLPPMRGWLVHGLAANSTTSCPFFKRHVDCGVCHVDSLRNTSLFRQQELNVNLSSRKTVVRLVPHIPISEIGGLCLKSCVTRTEQDWLLLVLGHRRRNHHR